MSFASSAGLAPAASCGAVVARRRDDRHLRRGRRDVHVQSPQQSMVMVRGDGMTKNTACAGTRATTATVEWVNRSSGRTGAARRRLVVCAAEGGDAGDAGGTPPPSAADALAERMAKAKAYKEQREKEAAEMDGNAELESVVQEAMARLNKPSDAGDPAAAPPEPEGPREVRVKIVTRDNNYNPFGEDEQVVGVEKGDDVFKPEVGGWGGEGQTNPEIAAMLESGRRRERGLGTEEDNAKLAEEDAKAKADADYQPKVSTWGVFPRPDNISKTYGGGKTIKAGEYVAETEEEKEARRARIREKMNKYREDKGVNISNGTLVRWQAALTESQTLMRQGKLTQGVQLLEPIVLEEKINPKSEIGGQITFNYAMCLDNVQRREEALEMYKRCVGNPYGKISKQADNLIWGMTTAAKKMKADQFDYDGIKDKYDPFLIKMTNEKREWQGQEMTPEEEEELNKMTFGSIAFVVALPLAMGVLIAMR